MRASHFIGKLLLSALFLPAFISAHSSDSSDHHCEAVFASYRNDADLTVPAGDNVTFNVKNANKGDGIRAHQDGRFTIRKPGFYLINYGLASIGSAGTAGAAFGFNLVRTRDGHHAIVDSVLTNSSSAVILCLKECDELTVVSQEFLVHLIAGSLPPRTTSLTDTAFISFLRLDR